MSENSLEVDLRLYRAWLKASRSLFDNIMRDIASYDLTLENFMVLELIYSQGPKFIQVISEILGIPTGSISYVVNKLEKLGVAVREWEERNKRYCKVVLTYQGKELFHDIFPKHTNVIAQHLAVLDENKNC